MLKTQLIDLKFLSGADTKTDDTNTIYTSFREMKNSRMDQIGAVLPRGGMERLINPSITTGTPAFDIVSNPTHTVYGGNNALATLSGISVNAGALTPALRGTLERLYAGDAELNSVSAASNGSLVCVVWQPTAVSSTSGKNKIGVMVFDGLTGRVEIQTTYTAGFNIRDLRVACYGTEFVVLVADSSFDLRLLHVTYTSLQNPVSNLTWSTAPTGTTAARFALAADSSRIYIAYAMDNSSTVSMQILTTNFVTTTTIATVASAFTFPGVAAGLALTTTPALPTARIAVFAGQSGDSVKGALFTNAGVAVGTVQTVGIGASDTVKRVAAYYDATFVRPASYQFSGINTTSFEYTHGGIYLNETTSSSLSGFIYPATLQTGAALIDLFPVAIAETFSSPTYGSQALVRIGQGGVSTRLGGLGASANMGQLESTSDIQLPNPVKVGTKTFFAVTMVTAVESLLAVPPGSAILRQVEITPKLQATIIVHDTAEHPPSIIDTTNRQNLYLGATQSQLTAYDRGAGCWPELAVQANLDLLGAAGPTRPAGTVSYTFAKTWKSADGIEYRTYSPIYTADFLINTSLRLVLRAMAFLGNAGISTETTIEAYRTEVNGTIFYKYATYGAPGTYQDMSIDSGIIGNRLADINAGELAPELPQSARLVANFKDRIALVGPDKPNTVLFNRPAPYPIGTSFASGLEVDVEATGGSLQAMVQMDSALYLFKSNRIYTLYGDAPGATGEGSTLTVPQLVFNGTGCTDPRSALLTPKGIMFKSGKGFYLIARNQQLEFIGAGPYTDNNITVTGSTITESQYEVMFTFSSGVVWVYNMDTGSWYEWVAPTNFTPRAITSTEGAVYMAIDSGVFNYTTTLTRDRADVFLAVPQDIVTGWFRFNNLRGFQRLKRLYIQGEVLEACTITIDVYMDYKDTPVMTKVLPVTALGELEIDLHMEVQKGEAMSFRIRTDKYGIKLSGATLEIGAKTGTDKSRTSGSNPS